MATKKLEVSCDGCRPWQKPKALRSPERGVHGCYRPSTNHSDRSMKHLCQDYIPAGNAAGLSGVNWHCLRHIYASSLAMNGATESTIAELLRHSGTGLIFCYTRLSPSHLQATVEGLTTFGTPIVTETGMIKRETEKN